MSLFTLVESFTDPLIYNVMTESSSSSQCPVKLSDEYDTFRDRKRLALVVSGSGAIIDNHIADATAACIMSMSSFVFVSRRGGDEGKKVLSTPELNVIYPLIPVLIIKIEFTCKLQKIKEY